MAVNKKLIVDISNQTKLLNATISADASNYFDRVIYLFAGLTCQYFRLERNYVQIFFCMIEEMKMYLLTSFRVSNHFYTGLPNSPF